MVHEHEYTLNWRAYNRINKLVADAYEETAKENIQKYSSLNGFVAACHGGQVIDVQVFSKNYKACQIWQR